MTVCQIMNLYGETNDRKATLSVQTEIFNVEYRTKPAENGMNQSYIILFTENNLNTELFK